jgi:hypothetical protein
MVCLALIGCGAATGGGRPASAATMPTEAHASAGVASNADASRGLDTPDASQPTAPQPTRALEVTAAPAAQGGSGGLDITATSDLPPGPPSTAQPFDRLVEAAIAPLRAAMAECMRPLGRGPRFYRVLIGTDGSMESRSPQAYPLSNTMAQCLEGLIHGLTISPPPARAVPYDVHFDVTS